MVMSMKFFGSKKRNAKRQQSSASALKEIDKSSNKTNVAVAKPPMDAAKVIRATRFPSPTLCSQRKLTSGQQQQPIPKNNAQNRTRTNGVKSTSQAPVLTHSTRAPEAEKPKRTQAPSSVHSQQRPSSHQTPSRDKNYQRKKSSQDSNHRGLSIEIETKKPSNVPNVATPSPSNNRTGNIPNKTTAVLTPPRSILHTHAQKTPQPTFAMGEAVEISPHNRVRFLSSNSSVASSCGSEVHLMAGPGSVASSSAMSSSRDAENVFDKVLHMVMAEEEDRLKAMGMSNAGSSPGFAGMSPAMYYKSAESPAMYHGGGFGGTPSSESDEQSPTSKPVKPRAPKHADAGQLIDVDTGMRIDSSCKSGNIECEYHDLNDDAIDTTKYRSLLAQCSDSYHLNESGMSGGSDCALNGSMSAYAQMPQPGGRSKYNESRSGYQQHAQHRNNFSREVEQREDGWPAWGGRGCGV